MYGIEQEYGINYKFLFSGITSMWEKSIQLKYVWAIPENNKMLNPAIKVEIIVISPMRFLVFSDL